ncbi:hypothetical protein [Croceimicrobium hydrocarbonivorans]|uniref:Uncharacterized protein n=1 Tax=Croceimicrobium hydrocarbonivorans TaxID=2761580 RepID=A0A7H0VEL3_9FLAO|nr:hypothetical protein [Croceimicrobium hydrocarbonivorans]QNR24161.1 hypothetical protein H4K34_17590 [Croceimicrobium hydrocarbonivorans]
MANINIQPSVLHAPVGMEVNIDASIYTTYPGIIRISLKLISECHKLSHVGPKADGAEPIGESTDHKILYYKLSANELSHQTTKLYFKVIGPPNKEDSATLKAHTSEPDGTLPDSDTCLINITTA